MFSWVKKRLAVTQAALPPPLFLAVFGILQAAWVLLKYFHPAASGNPWVVLALSLTPWWAWVVGWQGLLWAGTIEYSLKRKENFDLTSTNFFKAFLEFLIKEGHQLFQRAGEEDFYTKVNDWQRMVIQGIAIGLGPKESEKYFHKMDSLYPLSKAYRESQDNHSGEPLCRALQGNLEELEGMRLSLAETKVYEKGELEALKKTGAARGPLPMLPPK